MAAGHDRVVCEVNVDPPNPTSRAFHLRMGFGEVGHATLPGGTKTVSISCGISTPRGGELSLTL
jgi:predicted GNAT superfamily acetyltransferase